VRPPIFQATVVSSRWREATARAPVL
jgi:hypothetical protein